LTQALKSAKVYTYRREHDQVIVSSQLVMQGGSDVKSSGDEQKGEDREGPADPNDHGPLIVSHLDEREMQRNRDQKSSLKMRERKKTPKIEEISR
jgi:hypothetical protein